MTIKHLVLYVALSLGLITLAPVLALAQSTAGATTLTAAEKTAISRGDQEITRRTNALTDLNTRVQAMQKVTDAFKQNLSATIQTELTNLTALKAKIDADTDLATLKTDIKSVTQSYRIFALIVPQGRIAAAADREVALVSMMSTLGGKLQARVQASQQSGNDVTSLTAALTDMAAKIQDAQTQAEAAVTASAGLTPDNGDATMMASNNAALKTARADLKTANADLVAARKDITTIIAGLKAMPAAATASTTTQ